MDWLGRKNDHDNKCNHHDADHSTKRHTAKIMEMEMIIMSKFIPIVSSPTTTTTSSFIMNESLLFVCFAYFVVFGDFCRLLLLALEYLARNYIKASAAAAG